MRFVQIPDLDSLNIMEILQFGASLENQNSKFYAEMLEMDLSEPVRKTIESMVEEEKQHESFFEELLKDFFSEDDINPTSYAEQVVEFEADDFSNDREVLEMAAKLEKETENFYSELANKLDKGPVRRLIAYLAYTEREHYEKIQDQLRELN